MKHILDQINQVLGGRLWIKVMVPVSACVLLVMGAILWSNMTAQNRFGRDQLTHQNQVLARAVEGGMFDALAVGDNDTVRSQFSRLSHKVDHLEVYVYDFKGTVSFSTDLDAVGRPVKDYTPGPARADLSAMLDSGTASGHSFETLVKDEGFIVKNDPILNEKKCHHCHGHKRKVLGGISVLSSTAVMQEKIQASRNTSILIGLAGLALIIFMVWIFFFFLVNKKVGRVVASATRLQEKDFSREDEIRQGDEINQILNRISMVTRELRSTIQHIVAGAGSLQTASGRMSGIAGTLDSSSRETSKNAANVSAAAEEMSVTNRSIASAMDDAAGSLSTIAAAVDEMSATVSEIAKNSTDAKTVIDGVVKSFETILASVKELGVRADDVDEVTNEIRSISEQVSLLALNAKIEAARAGEAGKGFAVVAQEITELAADTGQSTLEADEKLAGIKITAKDLMEKVSGLSGSVRDSDHAIAGIAASVEEQNATTLEIARSINEVSAKISEVNQNVTQGAQVASDIARDILGVEEMSGRVQAESHSLSEGASDLAQMAQDFSDLMKQFKV